MNKVSVYMKRNILVIIIGFLTTQIILAQSVSIGPQAGFVKSVSADESILMPGGAIRINFEGLSIEGAVYQKIENNKDGSINTKSFPVQLTGIVKMFPYINFEIGFGWYNTKIDYSQDIFPGLDSETSKNIGYHVGVGSQLEIGRFMVTCDVRYVFLDLDLNNISNTTTMNNNFFAVMAGAMFRF
jgi:opacity protein-like surface antigen